MHVLMMSFLLSLAPACSRSVAPSTPVDAGTPEPAAAAPVASAPGEAAAQPTPKISLETARETALKQVPGTVIDAELERERGRWVYSIEIQPNDRQQPRKEVLVDADDGSVIAVEDEDQDD
jgi:uncharacterized membrane protein YkoI